MKENRLLWGLLLVVLVISLPLSVFFLGSGSFVPPNDPLPRLYLGGKVIALPTPAVATPSQPATSPLGAPEASVDMASLALDAPTMEDLIKDFHARHPNLPKRPHEVYSAGARKDLCEVFYGVLQGDEPTQTFVQILRGLNQDGRALAMHALGDANGLLLQGGYPALVNLWVRLQPADVDLVVQSAVEALLWDMERGEISNIPHMLSTMGDRARPAVPHLVWVSNNHPEADMRTWCMNNAWMIAPELPESRNVILRRLGDPDGGARSEALQALAIRSLASVIGSGRPSEEEIVEMHEQRMQEDAPKSKQAA